MTSGADILNSIVNKDYTTPRNIPVVKVDGESFNDVEAAFRKLVSLAKDGHVPTLEYAMDVSSIEFDPTKYGVSEGALFTFNTNGKAVKLPANSEYQAIDNGDGTYTVGKYVTLTWLDRNGDVIATEQVLDGSTVPLRAIENPYAIVNNYYKATYNAWAYASGEFVMSEGALIVGNTTLKNVAVLESTFVDLLFNIDLNDNLCLKYYLPKDFLDNNVEGVKFVSATRNGTLKENNGTTTLDGKHYYFYNAYTGYAGFCSEAKWVITYKVELDGYTYTLSREFSISPLSYVKYILEDKTDTFKDSKQHIANFLRFANEFMYVRNDSSYGTVHALYEEYKSLCSEYENDILDPTGLTLGELGNYIKAIYFNVSSDRAQYSIDFKENSKVKAVKITKIGVASGRTDTLITLMPYGNTYFDANNTYHKTWNSNALKFYNFFGTLNVELTVENDDGTTKVVKGTYDVNSWYAGASFKDDEEKAMWGDLLKALKELGDSTFAFRFERID